MSNLELAACLDVLLPYAGTRCAALESQWRTAVVNNSPYAAELKVKWKECERAIKRSRAALNTVIADGYTK
jgi:hypothetical protein